MKSVTTSWIVEGLFKSPRRPFNILTSGKTSSISLTPVRVGKPSLLAEVEIMAHPNSSHSSQTSSWLLSLKATLLLDPVIKVLTPLFEGTSQV